MSDLSNDFHSFLTAAKAEFHTLEGVAVTVVDGVAADAAKALTTLLGQVPAVVEQAAAAAVTAAIATAGNPAAILAAAEAAAINTLVQVGKPLVEADLAALKVAVLAHFVALVPAKAS